MSECSNNTTLDEVLQYYEAYHELVKILYTPENIIDLHMKPVQIAIIHNTRVLHGRTAIQDSGQSSKRWFQINYMDWDGTFSRLRVLQRKLGLKTPYLHEQPNDFFELRADSLKCCDDVLSCTYLLYFSHYLYLHNHIQGLRLICSCCKFEF